MTIDGRTPVIVGAAQRNHRDGGVEPIAMMIEVVADAMADAGGATSGQPGQGGLLGAVDEIRVVRGIWPYEDPGALVAAGLDLAVAAEDAERSPSGGRRSPAVRTGLTPIGGNEVYDLVAATAADIVAGSVDVAVICAAEHGRTRRRDRRAGHDTVYLPERPDAAPHERFGAQRVLTSPDQIEAGGAVAVNFYALAESVLRHESGRGVAAHAEHLAALWASAAAVAGDNPHAWLDTAPDAGIIGQVAATNRMVADPYPKLMTSNIDVDQAAAVVMCSAEAANALGLDSTGWVFPVSGAGAADAWDAAERDALHRSPAMARAADATLAHAGWRVDDVELLDLYSCFPAAVQVAQQTLGIDPSRDFTVTGGLTFAGGPLNSYCLHALARSVELLRDQPRGRALLSGNGGYFTKHSFLALSANPPERIFARGGAAEPLDQSRLRPDATPPVGTIEAHTVVYGRDGAAERAIATVLDPDGRRSWAVGDRTVAERMEGSDSVGESVTLEPGDSGVGVIT